MQRTWFRIRQFTEQFWFIPACMTVAGLLLAELGISLEERYGIPEGLRFVYAGGEVGSRSVLSAVASSSISTAGTIFSVTIAALSFSAGSMGPRLLDNFTRDRGNQITLGTFIGTFAFTLYSLRSVTGVDEIVFVPHYNVTAALVLAVACIVALVYFLAHVTGNINMTRTVNLLRDDMRRSLQRATTETEPAETDPAPDEFWAEGHSLRVEEGGYFQLLDLDRLLEMARREQVSVRLYFKPGHYLYPGAVVMRGVPHLPKDAMNCLTVGTERVTDQDPEYAVRKLAEVAARALSPGINDPVTANDVLDRFGDALCDLRGRWFASGLYTDPSTGRLLLHMPAMSFDSLAGHMLDMIRQYGADSPSVVIHFFEVIQVTATCLRDPEWRTVLAHHARLMREDAGRKLSNSHDLAMAEKHYGRTMKALTSGEPS